MEVYPKVSIIIPVYNYDRYIAECVDSCLAQTYQNIEVIVVDDGSTDKTPGILESYGNRIKYIRQENSGAAVALNKGVRASSGELIAWLSSDDVFLPLKIEKQVKLFDLVPEADLVYTDYFYIDSQGEIISAWETDWYPPKKMLEAFIRNNVFNGSTVLMRKEVWCKLGGFEEKLVAVVDTHFWIKLLLEDFRCVILPEKLVKYRTHPTNQTSNKALMQVYQDIVYNWAVINVPIERYYTIPKRFIKTRMSFYLFMNALFAHFRFKRYQTFISTYSKMPGFSIFKIGLFPLVLFLRLFKKEYLREFKKTNLLT